MRAAFVLFLALHAVGCAGSSLHAVSAFWPDPTFIVDLPRGWEETELSTISGDPSHGSFISPTLVAEAEISVGMTQEEALSHLRLGRSEMEGEGWLFHVTDDPTLAIATNEDRRGVLRVAKASTCALRQQSECYVFAAFEVQKAGFTQVFDIADSIGERVMIK